MYTHGLSFAFSYMYIYFSLLSFLHSPLLLSISLSISFPSFPSFLHFYSSLFLSSSSQRIQANKERVSALKQKILTYDTSLPPLIKAWASLKTSTVLHGDYDLKLQRQEYYLSKKDEVLKNLLDPFDRFCVSSCVCVGHYTVEGSTQPTGAGFHVVGGGASSS